MSGIPRKVFHCFPKVFDNSFAPLKWPKGPALFPLILKTFLNICCRFPKTGKNSE